MRDAQSALDQVLSFAGTTITTDDVSTVLGLVGRDLLFDLVTAVLDEDGATVFALADRAVESGQDLRLVCRELTRVVRDVMILSVDPSRAGDGELAEGELEQLKALSGRFSREDLMRAFDLLAKAEFDIRNASNPRHHFEMAMLKWMHVRKLVPLMDLLEQMGSAGGARLSAPAARPAAAARAPERPVRPASPTLSSPPASARPAAPATSPPATPARPSAATRQAAPHAASSGPASAASSASPAPSGGLSDPALKDALLGEIRAGKSFFYNTVVAQAQSIDVADGKVTFTFLPTHRALRDQFEHTRPWVEATAERLAGRKVPVMAVQAAASAAPAPVEADVAPKDQPPADKRDLKAEAMAQPAVQAVLDVFPGEIRNVEEL